MNIGNYRIVGVKLNPATHRYEHVTVYRDEMNGDNSASSAKFHMMSNGWKVIIRPTPGVWTEELVVP